METDSRVELLSPAGSPPAFYGAVKAGADAVYLGGSRFGARAYAENFTQDELLACIRYGRLFGVRVYLTVNTLLKETELAQLPDFLAPYYEAGLDAVIVQDLGVLEVVRECFPGLKIHASTQMTLCCESGVRLLKELGASRVVPARELSLEELVSIKDRADIELETFVHGAMCYCYSGQCLFSSILGGRSGNRGRCAQPCRLPYTVRTEGIKAGPGEFSGGRRDACHPLSLKDMCTVEHIPALIEAGIDSFKIEGRMKKPEYAAGVTAVYRKYIDRYYELRGKLGTGGAAEAYRVDEKDLADLACLYIRSEIQDGYYFRKNGREMVTLSSPSYRDTDDALLAEIRRTYLEERPKLTVEVEAVFRPGEKASVTFRRAETAVTVTGAPVETAQKKPITGQNLKQQLGKLGDSPFQADKMQIQVDENAFYPLKQVNELRRQAVCALEEELLSGKQCRPTQSICRSQNRPSGSTDLRVNLKKENVSWEDTHGQGGCRNRWAVSVRTPDQFRALAAFVGRYPDVLLQRVYLDGDLPVEHAETVYRLIRSISEQSACRFLAAMPYIIRREDLPDLDRLYRMTKERSLDGVLFRSLDGLGYLRGREKHGIWRADAGVYTWNSHSAALLGDLTDGMCLPYELNASEQGKLLKLPYSWEKIVYSRIPMMITVNCVLKTVSGCRAGSGGRVWLTDRYKKDFPVLRLCRHCTNIIYNSVPLSLHADISGWKGPGELRLDFTLETAEETEHILGVFMKGEGRIVGEYTTGHARRGVE